MSLDLPSSPATAPSFDEIVIDSGVFGPLTIRGYPGKADELRHLAAAAAVYVTRARGQGTLRAYRSAWRLYCAWCADLGFDPLNGNAELVGLYAVKASERVTVSTLRVHLAAIATAHRLAGIPLDLKHPRIALVLEGISRTYGIRAKRLASPLSPADLARMVDAQPDKPLGIRNRAMLLIGYGAALRRSELVALNVGDVTDVPGKGIVVLVGRSKTDQKGEGREVAICAQEDASLCAQQAWRTWRALRFAVAADDPLFCGVRKDGVLNGRRLSDKAVERLLKDTATALSLPDALRYTGHSLRAGLATAAGEGDAQLHDIMRQTRHRSVDVARRYLRSRDLWKNNVTRTAMRR